MELGERFIERGRRKASFEILKNGECACFKYILHGQEDLEIPFFRIQKRNSEIVPSTYKTITKVRPVRASERRFILNISTQKRFL